MYQSHGPLSNAYVLLSMLGFAVGLTIFNFTPSWGFLLVFVSVLTFLASYISAVRAPLMTDGELELAVHEKYHGRRYPDTDLHHGMIPKTKKMVHTTHKKKLVEAIIAEEKSKAPAKKTQKKATNKKGRR
jgi:hypothetical protein